MTALRTNLTVCFVCQCLFTLVYPTKILGTEMLKKLMITILFAASFNLAADDATQKTNEAAHYLAEKISRLRTYHADFEQRVQNEVGKEIDVSSGVFLIEKPNHFRLEVKQQFEQLIVADGDHIFTYEPDLEQVTIQNQSELLADSPLLFLTSNAEELERSFNIAMMDVGEEKNSQLFSLLPKGEGGVFEKVHILFKDNNMVELLMADTLGQQTTVKFSNIKINEKLDVKLFSFIVPEGVDVVDSRERAID